MRHLADAVLLLHFAVALFIVGVFFAAPLGKRFGWQWINAWPVRVTHLAAISFVAVEAWLGQVCPLTTLESWLRQNAGESGYAGSFVTHWVQRLLYYDAPLWVFTLLYTVMVLAAAALWWRVPPTPRRRQRRH